MNKTIFLKLVISLLVIGPNIMSAKEIIVKYNNGQVEYKWNEKGGVKEGKQVKYRPTGEVEHTCNYKNGVLSGEAKIYNKEGELVITQEYKNGVLKKPKELF
jgi:antitoxin component YwqK of YwqJK toxin-antitoxin module